MIEPFIYWFVVLIQVMFLIMFCTAPFAALKCTKTKREFIITISNMKQELGGASWKRINSSLFEVTRIE